MGRFTTGDRVRIDIPDQTDPDHDLHGKHGKVVNVLPDDAGLTTGDNRDSNIYCVRIDTGEEFDLRWRDLRPPSNDHSKPPE